MTYEITGRTAYSFEIDVPCMGLFIDQLPITSKIKVDKVSDNEGDVVVMPERYLYEYLNMFQITIADQPILFKNVTNSTYEEIYIPFALFGSKELDEVTRYKVTLTELDDSLTSIVAVKDALNFGTPIVMKRAEVRGTLTEKEETTDNSEFLVFLDGLPEKLEYRTAPDSQGLTRKIVVEQSEIEYSKKVHYLNQIPDNSLNGEHAMFARVWKVPSSIDKVIVHTAGDGDDFTFYKLDLE